MISLKIYSFICVYFFIQHVECKSELRILDDTSWEEMLKGEWMVEFFAPWCPACQNLEPIWREFAKWSDDLGIKIGNVDVTQNPGLSGRFMITALPTIYHIKDGVFRQYRGARDKESFFSFVEEKKWQSLEPVSSWTSPQSVLMAAVSYFFKLSMFLRSVHTTLVEDYGIPSWGSYFIFGLSTVVIGAVLGLIIVWVLDYRNQSSYEPAPLKPSENEPDDSTFECDDIIRDDKDNENPRKRTAARKD